MRARMMLDSVKGLQRSLSRFGLTGWFVAMLAIGSTLLARHVVALPRPVADAALGRAMASLRAPEDAKRWMAVHVLYAECRCSHRIAEHLLSSSRPPDVSERVLLVGRDADLEGRFAAHGLRVMLTDSTELGSRYHVAAVPLLVVVAPDDTVRYAGGYTTRKQGPDPQDLELVADARAGRSSPTLPIFGCAVSARLKSSLNPLGLP
jgi:hypothetical protein